MPQDRAHLQPPAPRTASASQPDADRSAALAGGTYFLGRYRVVDEIGVGGMASVHLARMDGPGGFQKWVAIKRIHPHLVEDESFVNMFLDEARVAARISHPNVATVFELGKHDDTYWIAMEYLHGEPLREVMRRTEELGQPMPPEIACRVIADAAEGLHSAHELLGRNGEKLGLVHRDVTPHNLFVTYDGCTKVVDFGIAKFASRMANTRAGTLKGKLAYMSPEQVGGEQIDRRTDVFALGVVLWELTTGQRLFRMENDLDTLAKVQECNVAKPSTIVRGYPIDLEKIVMKALAKNKNERFGTARELSRALQSLLMRRGLFIASDEVASYMMQVFGDRIQKREAHLRWAAEVTQTIDIDKMKAMAPPPWQTEDGSILTYNSEVQPSQPGTARVLPRPAAGAPPVDGPVSGIPTPLAVPVGARTPDLAQTLKNGGPIVSRAPAPAPRPANIPRPAAPAAPVRDDDHLHEDPPTIARPRTAPETPEDPDDNLDTVVSESFPEIEELRAKNRAAAAALQQPSPPLDETRTQAASPGAMAVHAAPRPAPARHPTLPPMPAVMVPAAPPPLPPPIPQTTMRLSQPSHPQPPPQAQPYPGYAQPAPQYAPPAPQPYPQQYAQPYAQPSQQPQPGPPFYGQPGPADMQRLFAPPQPNDQRTITAQALKKRIPVWAVAVASACVGLLAFALVVVLLSRSSQPSGSAKGAPGASAAAPSASVALASTGGPFVSARAQFAATLVVPTAPTTDTVSPPPAPDPAPAVDPATLATATPPAVAATSKPAPQPVAPPRPAPAPAPAAAAGGTGTLKVICFPGCDQVIDNGAGLGPSPVVRRNASLGSHRIKLVWGDSSKVVSTIVIADQTATVRENHP